jgi:hypothetical protein
MRVVTTSLVALALTLSVYPLFADALPGENLVFQQKPMEQTNIFGQTFFGHNEVSTAVNQLVGAPVDAYAGTFMADDFAVRSSEPITHIRFWGDYLENRPSVVQKFFISFEQDIPAGPNVSFSRPGTPLLSQIVTRGAISPGSGTFDELAVVPVPPFGETPLAYNAELAAPFVPTPNTVYWLKIVALTEPTLVQPNPLEPKFQWGWHNRDYTVENTFGLRPPAVVPGEFVTVSPIPEQPPIWHFQDDAVGGQVNIIDFLLPRPGVFEVEQTGLAPKTYVSPADGPTFIAQFSKDLAFELYAVPEPSTLGLTIAGMLGLGLYWLRRSRD